MAAISTTAVQDMLAGLFGDDAVPSAPATFYVGVSSTEPTMTGGVISGATEPTTGSYARVAVANNGTNWTITARSVANAADVTFPEAAADWDVSVAYFFIADASTAGNIVASGALNRSFTIYAGVTLVLDAGTVDITAAA